jgi:transposase
MYTLGIDVHTDESHVVVLDKTDESHDEVRVRSANLDEIAQQYAGADAAIEATSNYYTIYDTLNEHLEVVVADPNYHRLQK